LAFFAKWNIELRPSPSFLMGWVLEVQSSLSALLAETVLLIGVL